ncbi:MAG: type III toxin-antitoxin system ToxN/AbiQ family toxin [Clostridiales bacterium]|nr:type III toxin-antitoxin system ToxN/AbiQ family toxin [Clostridiales bacterium]
MNGEKDRLKLYYVTDRYTDYLRKFEKHVWMNSDKGQQRPYVGIVILLNGHRFYAPLTSPKPKHARWKDSLTAIRIEYKNELLAILSLNNMIPVPDSEISLVDIKNCSDKNYKNLLDKEIIAIRHKQNKIIRTANNLYNEISRVNNDKAFIQKIRPVCFDFKILEIKCDAYKE